MTDYLKLYYQRNKEHLKLYHQKYYQENKQKFLDSSKKWSQDNKERKAELKKIWDSKNIDKRRELKREWAKNNPEKVYQYIVNYYPKQRANQRTEKYRLSLAIRTHRRRSLLNNAEGSFTSEEWQELKTKCDNTCQICDKSEPEIKLTIDHIIPLSKNGTNYISNIQPLCKSCNSRKSNKID